MQNLETHSVENTFTMGLLLQVCKGEKGVGLPLLGRLVNNTYVPFVSVMLFICIETDLKPSSLTGKHFESTSVLNYLK